LIPVAPSFHHLLLEKPVLDKMFSVILIKNSEKLVKVGFLYVNKEPANGRLSL
jgi:hypothetical protein